MRQLVSRHAGLLRESLPTNSAILWVGTRMYITLTNNGLAYAGFSITIRRHFHYMKQTVLIYATVRWTPCHNTRQIPSTAGYFEHFF